jgi:UDP-glucose 4-epimerase
MFTNKTLLISGGTGSFGNAVMRRFLKSDIGEIRVLRRDEKKQDDMRKKYADPKLKFYIGDVRDLSSVRAAMSGVDYVFNAAALKQVPSCEFFPMEAVETNVAGSSNVIESAIKHRAKSVVCLGTDKAVYPVNAMGMTKALMEKVAQAAARRLKSDETRISCVRYGNVMYSRGSVIPLFVKQIKSSQSITVTEPQMTRFMLPLAGSVDLVKVALMRANQGDVFIKKAAAASIGTLVESLQSIFGTSLPVVTMGMRHGEKLHETLASAEELSRAEDLGEYFRIPMDARELNYSKYLSEGDPAISRQRDFGSADSNLLSVSKLKELLLSLPEIQAEV